MISRSQRGKPGLSATSQNACAVAITGGARTDRFGTIRRDAATCVPVTSRLRHAASGFRSLGANWASSAAWSSSERRRGRTISRTGRPPFSVCPLPGDRCDGSLEINERQPTGAPGMPGSGGGIDAAVGSELSQPVETGEPDQRAAFTRSRGFTGSREAGSGPGTTPGGISRAVVGSRCHAVS
jgi:hypothetical protein